MRRASLLVLALLLAVALDLAASGCVSLPRAGSVHSATVQENADGDSLIDYTPAGPERGVGPVPLVDNFLTAMKATPLNTYVAREYLTAGSSRSWVPERGTVIYGGQQVLSASGHAVTLRLRHVVELDDRGTWRGDPTSGRGHDYRLHLVKENGQWRIDHPPNRLIIPRTHFDSQYQQYLLYFFDTSAQQLVAEPVYVPRGRQAPTVLVADLLKGPRSTVRHTERTFFPKGSALDGISVPVSRTGTAEVPLSNQVLDVDDDQLNLVFAQLAWTLGQVPGVKRMRVTVDGTPIELPGSRAGVDVDGWTEFDPSIAYASTALFGLRSGRVIRVTGDKEQRTTGPLGALTLGVRSIGVDFLLQHVAAVTSDGRRVLEAKRDGVPGRPATRNDTRTVDANGTDLLRPAYDVFGHLWIVDRSASGARLSVVRSGRARALQAPGLTGADVERFALSRDGTRLAVQVLRHGHAQVLVARVQRDSRGRVLRVDRPRRLSVDGGPGRVRDIAWRSAASLAVLVGPTADESRIEVVKVDGSSSATDLSTAPELFRAHATRLVTSAAPGTPLLVDTPGDKLSVLSRSGRWVPSSVRSGLKAPVFAG